MGISWPKVRSSIELWESTGEKPVILQIEMIKWQGNGYTVRKGDESIEKQALDWNLQGTRRRGRWKEI
jgi:hypothetical protein